MTVLETSSAVPADGPGDPVVELRGVHTAYGDIEVFHGVALLGPNGAGKTTTMKIVSGLIPPTAGTLRFAGRDVTGITATEAAGLGVCSIPEGRGVFANLTVQENLWGAAGERASLDAMEAVAYTRSTWEADMLADIRRAEFHGAVAAHGLKTGSAKSDRPVRVIGALLMIAGVVGAFVAYSGSLSQNDLRDIGSSQILAIAFATVTVVGAGLYLAAAIAQVLRLWLLRQLVESQARTGRLTTALLPRTRTDEAADMTS